MHQDPCHRIEMNLHHFAPRSPFFYASHHQISFVALHTQQKGEENQIIASVTKNSKSPLPIGEREQIEGS